MKNVAAIMLMGAMLLAGATAARADDGWRGPDGRWHPRHGQPTMQSPPAQCPEGEIYYQRRDGRMVSATQLEYERELRARIREQLPMAPMPCPRH